MSASINYLAVLASAIAYFAIGGVWYTVFAKPWMKAVGKTEQEIRQRASALPYVASLAGALLAALILSHFVHSVGASTAWDGARIGLLGALAFAISATIGDYFFVGRPRVLFYINHGYHLIGLAVMGAILAIWK